MFRRLSVLGLVATVLILTCSSAARGKDFQRLRELTSTHQVAGAYTPGRIQTAYNFSPLYAQHIDGAGQTIALIELDKLHVSDITAFDESYGLSNPTMAEYYAGGTPFPTQKGSETALDVEWAHALAPGAAIAVYYIDDRTGLSDAWRSMARALRMAAYNGAMIVSMSLSACRPGDALRPVKRALADLEWRGVSVFVSSGDDGDHPGPARECGTQVGVGYPSGDPSVVSVGGTSLRLKLDYTISHEVAWKGSGGGRFKKLSRARWQLAPSIPRDRYRWVPDVAFVGDPRTGVDFVRAGTWRQAAGTSLGAPAWAAAWALVRQNAGLNGKAVAAATRVLYRIGNSTQYHAAFHDITSGSNGMYHAGVGWDPVTGWGTPDVAALAQTVAGMSISR